MRGWKHVVLLFGIFGVAGMFAPMLEVKRGRVPVELSARQLSFGLERPYGLVERDLPRLAERYLPSAARSTRDDLRDIAEVTRWAALAYAPSALLVLLGLAGVLRRRFGRVLGALTVLAALAQAGAWIGLWLGLRMALAEADLRGVEVSMMFGVHLLLLVAVVALLAGAGALWRPDRGRRRGPAAGLAGGWAGAAPGPGGAGAGPGGAGPGGAGPGGAGGPAGSWGPGGPGGPGMPPGGGFPPPPMPPPSGPPA